MFPNGWPGKGLLLMRLVVFSLTAATAIPDISNAGNWAGTVQKAAALACAFLLLIGLATPYAAIAMSVCEVWIVLSASLQWPLASALGGIAVALAMLGPGSVSIDALLFGRKRFDL